MSMGYVMANGVSKGSDIRTFALGAGGRLSSLSALYLIVG